MQTPLELAKSITDDEMDYISCADGDDEEIHKSALRSLIFDQDCVCRSDQYWHPYECIELRRWTCKQGHEREFAICNIIIAISIISGADFSNDPDYMLTTIAGEYDKLPNSLRDLVLSSLRKASENFHGG
jgi:hypothetical protein